MAGYIKLPRDIENHWIWRSPRHFQWFVQMIFMAAWKQHTEIVRRVPVNVNRGEFISSTRLLAQRFNCCIQAANDFIDVLEQDELISRKFFGSFTIFCIRNYDDFSGDSFGTSAPQFATQKPRKNNPQINPQNTPQNNKKNTRNNAENTAEIVAVSAPEIGKNAVSSEHFSEHFSEHYRRNKEIRNNIPPISARAREEEFFNSLVGDDQFWPLAAAATKSDIPTVKEAFGRFQAACQAKEKYHSSREDLKTHFMDWLPKALRDLKTTAPAQNTQNKTARQNGNQNQFSNRRQSGVSNLSEDDLRASFQNRNAPGKNC